MELNSVELPPEVERHHVALVQRNAGVLGPRDGEHAGIEIDALDPEGLPQVREMPAGAAGDIEEVVAGRGLVRGDDLGETRGLLLVVLPGVDRVVELLGPGEHFSSPAEPAARRTCGLAWTQAGPNPWP